MKHCKEEHWSITWFWQGEHWIFESCYICKNHFPILYTLKEHWQEELKFVRFVKIIFQLYTYYRSTDAKTIELYRDDVKWTMDFRSLLDLRNTDEKNMKVC